MGQKLIAAVATNMTPTHPHGVFGPIKTKLINANPNTNLTTLSMVPIFAFITMLSKLSPVAHSQPNDG